jgi:hypothetical protein
VGMRGQKNMPGKNQSWTIITKKEGSTMKKIKQLICATIIFFGLCINTTALDKLSDNEMGDVVGQSGIDLTIPGCEFKISFDQFAINDDKGYVVANGPLEYIKIMDATIPILNELSEIEENKG